MSRYPSQLTDAQANNLVAGGQFGEPAKNSENPAGLRQPLADF
jgi:hypothetical protein